MPSRGRRWTGVGETVLSAITVYRDSSALEPNTISKAKILLPRGFSGESQCARSKWGAAARGQLKPRDGESLFFQARHLPNAPLQLPNGAPP